MNHGKESSKFNQDCTICVSCHGAVWGCAVRELRENRHQLAGNAGHLERMARKLTAHCNGATWAVIRECTPRGTYHGRTPRRRKVSTWSGVGW